MKGHNQLVPQFNLQRLMGKVNGSKMIFQSTQGGVKHTTHVTSTHLIFTPIWLLAFQL